MRVDESTYNDLVSAFYDASLDAAGWPDALTRASDALSAIGAIYISLDFRRPECSQYELGRLDPDLMQPYLARHCRNDPWTRITTSMQVGATCALDAFVPATVLVQSELYAEVLRPQRILHGGATILARDQQRCSGFAVFRSPEIGPIGDQDIQLLTMLQPHIKRAAQIAARLATSETAEDAKTRALDQIDHGVLLVDRRGNILFGNRVARAIISLEDGLAIGAHGLQAQASTENRRLEALIAEAANGAAGGTMRVSRPSLAEPWLLLVAPARSRAFRAFDAGAAAIIFMTDPGRAPMPAQEALSDLFGLTATEAKVALCIAGGHDVPSAARQLRVSTNTVHTHMRRVFSKLGVHRQADVVRILMRAGITARADSRPNVAGRASA